MNVHPWVCSRHALTAAFVHAHLMRALIGNRVLFSSSYVRGRKDDEVKADVCFTVVDAEERAYSHNARFRKKQDRNTADILKRGGGSVGHQVVGNAILPFYAANPQSNPHHLSLLGSASSRTEFSLLHAPDLGRASPGSAVTIITMIGWSRTQSDRI